MHRSSSGSRSVLELAACMASCAGVKAQDSPVDVQHQQQQEQPVEDLVVRVHIDFHRLLLGHSLCGRVITVIDRNHDAMARLHQSQHHIRSTAAVSAPSTQEHSIPGAQVRTRVSKSVERMIQLGKIASRVTIQDSRNSANQTLGRTGVRE